MRLSKRSILITNQQIPLTRTKLTQSIAASTPGMLSEIEDGLHTLVGEPKGIEYSFQVRPVPDAYRKADWKEVVPFTLMAKVVARASNCAFSGTLFSK